MTRLKRLGRQLPESTFTSKFGIGERGFLERICLTIRPVPARRKGNPNIRAKSCHRVGCFKTKLQENRSLRIRSAHLKARRTTGNGGGGWLSRIGSRMRQDLPNHFRGLRIGRSDRAEALYRLRNRR